MDSSLSCITPIDGRYSSKTSILRNYFSEKALIRYRLRVEIEYFINLLNTLNIEISDNIKYNLRSFYLDIKDEYIIEIKQIENKVKHDVKAIEIFLRNKLTNLNFNKFNEYVHFGLTSQDINSTSYMLSMHDANKEGDILHVVPCRY